MNLEKELLKEGSKKQIQKIVSYVNNNPERFSELIQLYLSESIKISRRASWAASCCCERHPEMIKPHLASIIKKLKSPGHSAVIRHTLRILQTAPIPKNLWGTITDFCFTYLASKKEPVAVKVFAMSVLYRISQHIPELQNELRILIEDQIPYESAAFRSRGQKTLSLLNKKGPLTGPVN